MLSHIHQFKPTTNSDKLSVLAQTKPTKHRPAASYKVYEGTVTLYGKSYRAI